MSNVRVFNLARDLRLTSQEVIDRLHKLGVEVKTASSSVDEDTADKLRRALKIDALSSKRKRVYGSDEDEDERDRIEREQQERIAAERAAREKAAEEARLATEARRLGKPRRRAEAESADAAAAALAHAPGAPRLAPRAAQPALGAEAETEAQEPAALEPEATEAASAAAVSEELAPPAGELAPEPVGVGASAAAAAAAAGVVRTTVTGPRLAGPVRPIAPVPPPAPTPVAVAPPAAPAPAPTPGPAPAPVPVAAAPSPAPAPAATMAPRAAAPRPLRPIAPPRPVSPHPTQRTGPHPTSAHPTGPHPTSPHATAGGALPRSPHAIAGRPGTAPAARPGLPPRPGGPGSRPGGSLRPVGRPAPRSKGKAAPVVVQREERPAYSGPPRKVTLTEGVTVKELSDKMSDVKSRDVMKALITRGVMATVNQSLDPNLAIEVAREFGYEASIQSFEEELVHEQAVESKPEDLAPRAPVITVMGHVDHGKTSLLDAIRQTTVAAGEAGGITQHIGAYHVDVGSRRVVFLDTPGHEAFTLMRARGAKVTDIVVLVVAADDGVMPQTVEAMDHAKAAGVPIVVAVNKIDKPDSQPDRVRQQLSDRGLMPEEWGGSTVFVNVSAKKKQNLEQLLEMLLLVADLQELKANPKKPALGTVLEARLDKGRGPVATVLVQDGTLRIGDTVVAGAVTGKIRALVDDRGSRLKIAGPSTPVEVLGLPSLPEPGDQLLGVTDQLKAQSIVNFRQLKMREKALAASSRVRLEDLGRAIAEGQLKELLIVLKADVQGSLEAVADQLNKLPQEKIRIRIIRQGVGAVTEGDVLLAAASNAVVIGFNVRPERKAAEIAERDEVELRLYTIIYDVADDMKKAMEGLLEPTIREVRLGAAEVRDTFKISKVGTIAGCYVQDGRVTRTANVRLLRDNVVIHTGKVSSLKRFKDDASEVKSGLECGIGIAGYNDVKPGDVIEFFTTERVKETLT
ncbi:MAG TPA: translation initiation factor IF-2 [Vicinamibacteria bacterium]|nr:translation initiation factor IF-2 [Vicinamibacteria bacterium]